MNKKLLGLSVACLFASVSAFAFGGEAVIAYNPQSGAWGSYHGVPTFAQASADAQAECGAGCSVETYAFNGWIALARNTEGNYGTGGLHNSEYDAEQSAISNCEASAARAGLASGSCYVVRSLASFADAPDLNGVGN